MQVFVNRADLVAEDANHRVNVIAAYGNGMVVTVDLHGASNTVIFAQDDLGIVQHDRDMSRDYLIATWRDNYKPVINYEANRRINLVFPEYKQRNYTAQYQDYMTRYGLDTGTWPPDTATFLSEYQRGWKYVNDVRTASNAWTGMPAGDPTADTYWPPAISPIQ